MSLRSFLLPLAAVAILYVVYLSERVVARPEPRDRVRVVYWEKWTNFEGDAMRAVVDAFNRRQDRIHVDLLQISGIEQKTLMAAAGGIPPDVAGLYGPNVAQYADDHAIMPLDDLCRRHGVRAEQYIPAYWDLGIYRGRVYALPTTPASTALHYNRRHFREVGLDPDKPPKTIEEMDRMAEVLYRRGPDGKIVRAGFMHSEPGWWNWGWGAYFGGRLWDGRDRVTANSPENLRAFEWIRTYSEKYGVRDLDTFRSGFGNFSSPQNAFISERVAMELQGVWMANFIKMNQPKDKPLDWAAAPFPHPADRPDLAEATYVDEDVLVIPRGARHPAEAFEFIAFVQSQEGMELLCMGQRKHTPLVKVSPEFIRNHPNPFIELFIRLPRGRNTIPPPKTGLWPEYGAEMNNAFDEVFLLKKSPKAALDNVQRRMQEKMDAHTRVLRLRGEAP